MKKISLLLIAVVAVSLVVGVACRDDVILPPDPVIIGDYVGTYSYIVRSGANVDTLSQAIKWTFAEVRYRMDADTAAAGFDADACLCRGRGTYAITDRVRMEPDLQQEGPDVGCSSCNPELSPRGNFTLERPSDTRVKLTSVETVGGDQVTRVLQLERVTQ